MEVAEIKFGFIPNHDQVAYRVRRRYRILKGGHPQLILIHYSRGQTTRAYSISETLGPSMLILIFGIPFAQPSCPH